MNYETWEDIKNNARNLMQPRCMVCPVCNGKMDIHVHKDQYFVTTKTWYKQKRQP